MSEILVEYDKKTGRFLQSLTASNLEDYAKIWREHGKTCLIVTTPIEISGEILSPNQCNFFEGKITQQVITQEQIDQEKKAVALDDAYRQRSIHQPKPIHSIKLAIALSGNHSLLEVEASSRGISPQELADQIISKAAEAMAAENEYQAKIAELEKA